jgi:rSAM/selenodomain-associated transferase 2
MSRRRGLTPEIPAVSVIIPVLNESAGINDLIAHLHAIEPEGSCEIIVVDGDSHGGTLKAIRDTSVVKAKSLKGRGRQMNEGAKIANGNILLFLHADSELPREAFSLIVTALNSGKFVAGAFDLGIKSKGFVFRLIESMASVRSRITRIPFGDQAIFIRRAYFLGIGGYKDMPIMEDVEIMQRIKKRGDKICIIRLRALTSARRWEKEGVLRCTLRNWLLQTLYFFGMSPDRLSKWYK